MEQERKKLIQLRDLIRDRFNESELRDLCFDLLIPYDELPGQSTADKTRELVDYLRRRSSINSLIDYIRQRRADINPKLLDSLIQSDVNRFLQFDVKETNIFGITIQKNGYIKVYTPGGIELTGKIEISRRSRRIIDYFMERLHNTGAISEDEAKILGSELYDVLFNGNIRVAFEATLSKIIVNRPSKLTLSLRFDSAEEEWLSLPWEILYHESTLYSAFLAEMFAFIRTSGPTPRAADLPDGR